jgi:hypothetical protein
MLARRRRGHGHPPSLDRDHDLAESAAFWKVSQGLGDAVEPESAVDLDADLPGQSLRDVVLGHRS